MTPQPGKDRVSISISPADRKKLRYIGLALGMKTPAQVVGHLLQYFSRQGILVVNVPRREPWPRRKELPTFSGMPDTLPVPVEAIRALFEGENAETVSQVKRAAGLYDVFKECVAQNCAKEHDSPAIAEIEAAAAKEVISSLPTLADRVRRFVRRWHP
jgi:hypothetical protein